MAGKLKPLEVARQVTPGKYPDGDGLHLVVASATSKNWSYRYWKDGKQRWLGRGSVKEVSLKEARLARDAARLRVKGDRSTAVRGSRTQRTHADRHDFRPNELCYRKSSAQPDAQVGSMRNVQVCSRDEPRSTTA